MERAHSHPAKQRLDNLLRQLRQQTPEPELLRCSVSCQCMLDLPTVRLMESLSRDRTMADLLRLSIEAVGHSIGPRDIQRAAEAVRLARKAHGKRAAKVSLHTNHIRRMDVLCSATGLSRPAALEGLAYVYARLQAPQS